MARSGISQATLARRMHRTQQYVSRRVTGNIPFNVDELDEISRVLDVPVEAFFASAPKAVSA